MEWSKVDEDGRRSIGPVAWTGGNKDFTVNITAEEVEKLKDGNGEIRCEKVLWWCLPLFGGDDDDDNDDQTSLFEFQAACMRNNMRKRMVEDGWKSKFYTGDKVITGNHVARFYGVCLAKMLMRYRSINQIISTRGIFDAVPSVQASMTKNALEDLTTSLHYSDDWDVMGIWSH